MNINDAFPSSFLKASDLQGKNVTAVISGVSVEEIGQGPSKERKLIISFSGKEKRLVCNKTNAKTIGSLYGTETDGWIGKQIILTAREVEFQGETVLAVRVSLQRPVAPRPAAPPSLRDEPPAPDVTQDDFSNDPESCPF